MRVLVAWSSGKDSAWTLDVLRRDGVEVTGLLTTVEEGGAGRVAMHHVPRSLLDAQAVAARLPLLPVSLPWPCSNDEYERRMAAAVARARAEGVTHVAFGDLFIEDIRAYRKRMFADSGIAPLFPLWHRPTDALAREMIAGGLRATLTCVDPRQLDGGYAGREFDARLLAELPAGVDPCGERGEFHTFCHAGPMFAAPIPLRRGCTVQRDGFVYAELLPAS